MKKSKIKAAIQGCKTTAERIKAAREALGLSQVDAAKTADISQGYWSDLEAGKWDGKVGTLRKVAAALGLTLSALVD